MRLYVMGPISGVPNRNRPEFERVQEMLLLAGHDARIPHQFGEPGYSSGRLERTACAGLSWYPKAVTDGLTSPLFAEDVWRDWMWFDLHALAAWRPDGAVALSDWGLSRGATTEYRLFEGLGLPVWVNSRQVFMKGNLTWVWSDGRMYRSNAAEHPPGRDLFLGDRAAG